MRYSASYMVLILVGLALVVGLLMSRSGDPTSSVAAENNVVMAPAPTPAAEVADVGAVEVVATGGSGSTATVAAEVTTHEWVRVPGTGVAIWPRPRPQAD
jgi:hypothetical protein